MNSTQTVVAIGYAVALLVVAGVAVAAGLTARASVPIDPRKLAERETPRGAGFRPTRPR